MTRALITFVGLCALGLIGLITAVRVWGEHDFFGPAEDLVALAVAALVIAGCFVIWTIHAVHEIQQDVRDEEHIEDLGDISETSIFPEIRGAGIRALIGSLRRRIGIMISAYDRFGWPFLLFGLLLCLIALRMAFSIIAFV